MKLHRFLLICCGLSVYKLIHDGITEWWVLYIGLALLFMVLAMFAKGFADDAVHKDDPNWTTMGDGIKLFLVWKIIGKLFK